MTEGYKQTEIGVIPEDWGVCTLSDVYELSAGGDLNSNDFSSVRTPKHKYRILSNTLQNDGVYGYCSKPQYKGNAITITGRGDIGHSQFRKESFSAIIRLLVCQPKVSIASKYISDYLEAKKPFVYESTGVPQLTVPQIKNTLIPLPPLAEQRCIAEALSDVDELIASLEKLIAKKKAIKQGAMQELLTGKRRLPGLSGEWVEDSFENLFDILPNNAYTKDQMSFGGNIKNVHYGDILTKYGAILDAERDAIPTIVKELEAKARQESAYVQSGDVIIADTAEDETVGKAVEVVNVTGRILSGQHTFFCRPRVEFAPMFLGYYINSEDFHSQMLPFITGTKVSSINKASLNVLKVRYPSVQEQEAIAGLLYDMDNEVKAIEQKVTNARQIKQGMMQQLLTGNTRLL